jgi:hypothetical protein
MDAHRYLSCLFFALSYAHISVFTGAGHTGGYPRNVIMPIILYTSRIIGDRHILGLMGIELYLGLGA